MRIDSDFVICKMNVCLMLKLNFVYEQKEIKVTNSISITYC